MMGWDLALLWGGIMVVGAVASYALGATSGF